MVTADKDKEADPLSYFSHYFGFRRTRREPETKQEMGSTTGEKESARSTMMSPKESARSSARPSEGRSPPTPCRALGAQSCGLSSAGAAGNRASASATRARSGGKSSAREGSTY